MSYRISLFLAAAMAGAPAFAHPGHLIDAAGHNHWGALIAIGAAGAVAIWAAKKGKKSEEAQTDEQEEANDEELQEA